MVSEEAARSFGENRIEPIKHLLKKYLTCASLAMLTSAVLCRKKYVLFRTSPVRRTNPCRRRVADRFLPRPQRSDIGCSWLNRRASTPGAS